MVFEKVSGPAKIEKMPPSPESNTVWYSVYCRECGIEEGLAHEPDSMMLTEKRDRHNANVHGEADPVAFDTVEHPGANRAMRFNQAMLLDRESFGEEIALRIREIGEAMDRIDEGIVISVLESRGYTVTKAEPEREPKHETEVDVERWRCLQVGCNPKLFGEPVALHHSVTHGHRVAKWPQRSAEGKRRERERNRNGYHRRYQRDRDERGHEREEDDFHGGDYGQ